MSEIDDLIARLDAWLQQNRPGYYSCLNPGATSKDIQELQHYLGWNLPDDIITFYQWKNGEDLNAEIENDRYGFIYFEQLIPTQEIIKRDITTKPNKNLMPITLDGSGCFYFLDSFGYETKNQFQILYHSKSDVGKIESSSFTIWLKRQLFLMESGAFEAFADGENLRSWEIERTMPEFDPGFPKDFDMYKILNG